MNRKKSKHRVLQSLILVLMGFFLGAGTLWPGIIRETGRKCFFKIITDGSDGNVSLGTLFSITPNYLLKIKNAKNKYNKVLLVGDYCFRKF